jgi:hypothetical protein
MIEKSEKNNEEMMQKLNLKKMNSKIGPTKPSKVKDSEYEFLTKKLKGENSIKNVIKKKKDKKNKFEF